MGARPPKLLRSLARRFGFDLVSRGQAAAQSVSGDIVSFDHKGVAMRFFVCDARDEVQAAHANGAFYEPEELSLIASRFRSGGVFVDVGANVGNHAVFAAAVCGAEQVICFEPSAAARMILAVNLALNGVAGRARIEPFAVSDRAGAAALVRDASGALGTARLHAEGAGEAVSTVRLDDVAMDRPAAFIKIDVEGHEVAALRGAQSLMARDQPDMLIEVANENRAAVDALLATSGYRVAASHRRYRENENLLVVPSQGDTANRGVTRHGFQDP